MKQSRADADRRIPSTRQDSRADSQAQNWLDHTVFSSDALLLENCQPAGQAKHEQVPPLDQSKCVS